MHRDTKYITLILGLFVLGLGLRLYDITDEPLEFHSTRQLRGAIVARGMYYEMLPQADPAVQARALAFWQSVGQYEPSILERLTALTYLAIGEEVIWIAQLYSSLFWIIGGLGLLALAKRFANDQKQDLTAPSSSIPILIAVSIAVAYYMVLPFSVQASRTIQPDPGMVMWIILGTYALYRWSETQSWKWALLAGILAGLAAYTKAVAAYPLAGMAIAMVLYTGIQGNSKRMALKRILLNPQVWAMAVLMILPTALFYLGKGERSAEYFTSWTVSLSHLLLDPWFYARWLNTVRKLIGIIPLLLLPFSLWLARPRQRATLIGLWAGYFIYGLFLPYQMYTHNYYHLQLVPLAALSMIPALQAITNWLAARLAQFGNNWRIVFSGTLIALAALVLFFACWQALIPQRARDSRSEPAFWQEVAASLPADGKTVALTQDYGYRIMYYGWRKVTLWPNRGEQNLSELRDSKKEFETLFAKHASGKSYFLITSFKQFEDQPVLKEYLNEHFPLLAENSSYIIFDLRQPKEAP